MQCGCGSFSWTNQSNDHGSTVIRSTNNRPITARFLSLDLMREVFTLVDYEPFPLEEHLVSGFPLPLPPPLPRIPSPLLSKERNHFSSHKSDGVSTKESDDFSSKASDDLFLTISNSIINDPLSAPTGSISFKKEVVPMRFYSICLFTCDKAHL